MLILRSLEEENIDLPIDRPKLAIGRDAANDLVLHDDQVSGFHACILFENGQVDLVDLGSTNGTYCMGERIAGRTTIQPWARLRFGATEFELVDTSRRRPTVVQNAISDDLTPQGGPLRPPASQSNINQTPAATLNAVYHDDIPKQCAVFDKLSIGRDAGNHLVLDLPTISSRHAEIISGPGGLELIDLGSANGTWVNNRRVVRQTLRDGDRVKFDEIEYEVSLPGQRRTEIRLDAASAVERGATAVNPVVSTPGEFPDPNKKNRFDRRETAALPVDGNAESPLTAPPVTASATNGPAGSIHPLSGFPGRPPSSGSPSRTETAELTSPSSPLQDFNLPDVKTSRPADLKWLLFSIEGRISRLRWFLWILGMELASILLAVILQVLLYGRVTMNVQSPQYLFCGFIAMVVFLWPNLALCIKRFHDQGRSGHWCWLMMLPVISVIPFIMLLFIRGTSGVNQYGPSSA